MARMAGKSSENTPRLLLRQARPVDVPQLVELTGRVYGPEWGHSAEMLRSQQTHFPEGQFVVEYDDRIVGYCGTFRIDEAAAILGKTRTQFMIESARQQAVDVLLDQRLFTLDPERYDAFMQGLDKPPAPGPKLKALLRRTPAWQK